MKRCLFTLMSNNFFIAFKVYMKSFLDNNPWFSDEMVVLAENLPPSTQRRMLEIYDRITFIPPKYGAYSGTNFNQTIPSLKSTYYKLDAFSLLEYDRVIQLDMDMICQGDMKEVFDCDEPIGACRTYRNSHDALGKDINSGVFVLNKPVLNLETYVELINRTQKGQSMPDQKIINQQFRHIMFHLPKKYNVEKRALHSRTFDLPIKEWINIHYVGKKPWHDRDDIPESEKRYVELEDIWWEWHDKYYG